MALSDFFPYGAPEVLDGAPARMARSTMTASLGVALLVVMGGALLSRQVTLVIEPDPIVIPADLIDVTVLQPPPSNSPPVPRTEVAPREAVPVPVPDVEKKVIEPDPGPPPTPTRGTTTEPGPPSGTATETRGFAPTRDPLPGEYVAVDEMPAQVRCTEPRYPDLARSAGVEGTVVVQMLIGRDGRVERAILAPRGSIPMLDQAALDAALTCVFTPALSNGHAVKVWVSQRYRFKLH